MTASEREIPYGVFFSHAFVDIVRNILKRVELHGLHAPHAIFLTFQKNHPGVEMPQWLRSTLGNDVTIVLENQYEGFSVTVPYFEVTLFFSGKPARMRIPFTSITDFVDPGAGIAFTNSWRKTQSENEEEPPAPRAEAAQNLAGNVIQLSAWRK